MLPAASGCADRNPFRMGAGPLKERSLAMRRRTVSLGLLLYFAVVSSACASETYLPAQLQWVNFEMVMGRLNISSARYGSNKTRTILDEATGVRQILSLSVAPRGLTARFELTRPGSQLTITVQEKGSANLTLIPVEDGGSITPVQAVRVQLDQPSAGDMTLVIGSGAAAREYKAKSFWHLAISQPEIVAQHVTPLLQTLRPHWDLTLARQDLERAVLTAPDAYHLNRLRVDQLVKDLGADKFATRQQAYGELVDMGQGVLTQLDQLDFNTLDREQRVRIAAIRKTLTIRTGDTPARIARWLYDDQQVWLALMQRRELDTRRIAAARLSRLTGNEYHVDEEAPGTRVAGKPR